MNPTSAAAQRADAETPPRHLRPVEAERKGARFAALDHDVARVLGPHRGPAVLYGFLASAWYEYADPQKLAERKKKITPGDWVEVDYRAFMQISGTNAKASIIRWLRILAEDTHACPWSRCGNEHPLIVVQRQGQSRPNRYRKWRCGEDTLVIRPRVRSRKLSEAARRRIAAGQRLNGIPEGPPAVAEVVSPDAQLALLKSHEQPEAEVSPQDFSRVSPQDDLKSTRKTSESLDTELQEVSPQNARKSSGETSLREKTLNTDSVGGIPQITAANPAAAAIEEADEVDAVACDIVEAIITLAERLEPTYPESRAWEVARRLAAAVLEHFAGNAASARAALLHAIADRRLVRASNPIGLLIRGVVGDARGADRYLLTNSFPTSPAPLASEPVPATQPYETSTGLPPGLHEALLEMLRSGRTLDATWLRDRDISAQAFSIAQATIANEEPPSPPPPPLAEALAQRDPAAYHARLEAILTTLKLPALLGVEPRLDHPMLLGMCIAQLNAELESEGQP